MGLQYTDMVYQRDKYKKKYEEEKLKNASLEKDIQRMRERQEELHRELNRLQRREEDCKRRHQLDETFVITAGLTRALSSLGMCTDDLDNETLYKIMRGE